MISVHNHYDKPLLSTKYIADVTRTWVWNDVGTASFAVPRTHPRLAEIVEWGNIIRIAEPDLPTWIGQVVDRTWTKEGVQLDLRSMEATLADYITDQGLVFGADGHTTSGAIVRAVARNAWGNGWTPVTLGGTFVDIYHYKQYDYAVLLDILQDLAAEDKAAFWIDETLRLQYAIERGAQRADEILIQDVDLINVSVRESRSEVLTNALALGAGSDLVSQPKLGLAYGGPLGYEPATYYHAEVLDFNEAIDQNALRAPTIAALKDRFRPKLTVEAEVIDRNNNWKKLRMGDYVLIAYWADTFKTARAKIIGQELSPGSAMRCVFEVIPELPTQDPLDWKL
jgi:hypothetical protein